MKWRVLSLLMVSALVAACGGSGTSSSQDQPAAETGEQANEGTTETPTAPSTPDSPIPITLVQGSGSMVWLPTWVALSQGYFEDEGLEVEWIDGGGGAGAAQALLSGAGEIAAVPFGNVISATAEGRPAPAFAPVNTLFAADWCVSKSFADQNDLTADTPLEDQVRAMQGESIAVGNPGGTAEVLVRFLFEQAGLDAETDAEMINFNSAQAANAALVQGQVVATTWTPPACDQLMDADEAVRLLDVAGGDIPELSEVLSLIYATTPQYAEENPEVLTAFSRAIIRAFNLLNSDPDSAKAGVRELENFSDLDEDTFETSFASQLPGMPTDPTISVELAEIVLELQSLGSGTPPDVAAADTIMPEFLDRAKKELDQS